jgi:protein gp37
MDLRPDGKEIPLAQESNIEWTEVTWNPTTGCTKISPGCKHCYAERIAYRFAGMHGYPERPHHFDVKLRPDRLDQPLSWKKPRVVFVDSMSDLFHPDVPLEFIQKVLAVMRLASEHTFQVLTKRSERLLQLDEEIDWPANVWMGVSVENEAYQFRIDHLRQTGAVVKFLSLEPLLGPLPDLHLQGVDWVIVGGESGPKARPLKKEWVVDIKRQCKKAGVAFFFKQWGGVNKKRNGRSLDGRTWDEMPVVPDSPMMRLGLAAR